VRGPLHLVRKLGGPGRLNAVAAGQLIHMLDQISNRCFLMDTGASYSILPHRSSLPASGPKVFGPAGQPVPCWGDRLVQLPGSAFYWKFLLADVAFLILGVDFLRAHKLLIDPEGHTLLDSTGRPLAGQLLHSPPTATVVVGFVQPMVESSSSSAHTAGAARAAAPEQPAPEQPAPEQPAPEQPAPEQPAPEQPAPEQPAPDQFLSPVSGQPRRRQT
jgi:hypothetical protein